MKLFNNVIAIDKDDTLNFLTLEICKMAGITELKDIPSLDEIKAKKAPEAFYKARTEFFSDVSVFATAPYGGARSIVDMAKEHGFVPKICTKTMTTHPEAAKITMHKMEFWLNHFKDIEMHIVTGTKSIDAIGLIDDSASNGFDFNSRNFRPFLVWSHKYNESVYTEVLNAFYKVTNNLFHNQDEIAHASYGTNKLLIDFQGDKIKVSESPSTCGFDDYISFYSTFGEDGLLYEILYRGNYTAELNELVNIIDSADISMENDERNLVLIAAYNIINALKV